MPTGTPLAYRRVKCKRFNAKPITVSAILAATHGGKKKLGTVFLAEWIFLKTALKAQRAESKKAEGRKPKATAKDKGLKGHTRTA
ncbi:MAG: hypothetical protein IVW51_12820 [Thermaceae bacterium]|nr:hypothetical protein [Thermaceae bacterium]